MTQEIIKIGVAEEAKTPEKKGDESTSVTQYIIIFILAVCAIFFVALPFCGAWDAYRYAQVKAMEDVGRITGAAYQTSGFFSPATSAITTEKGTFVVEGILQGLKGHRMRIEYRENGDRALCDLDADICKRMLGH